MDNLEIEGQVKADQDDFSNDLKDRIENESPNSSLFSMNKMEK